MDQHCDDAGYAKPVVADIEPLIVEGTAAMQRVDRPRWRIHSFDQIYSKLQFYTL
jgi:hypothetical protein